MPERGMCVTARIVTDEAISAARAVAAYRLIERRYGDDPAARTELLQMLGFIPTQRARKSGAAAKVRAER